MKEEKILFRIIFAINYITLLYIGMGTTGIVQIEVTDAN